MFCKINKVIDIGTLLKRHELADAGQLSEDEGDIAHRENQLAELFQKTRDRFQRNYKRLLELALGLKARSDDSTRLKIQIGKYVALDPTKKLHPRTGPSTALGSQSRGARPCNAVLHDMTTVEAAHIAYGRVQTEEDGDFKYRDFYRNIVELIEYLLDREQIFKEWNMKLFNNDDGRDVARDDAGDSALSSTREGGSDLARLRAQMAARNAAAKTDTTDLERLAAPPTVAHPPSAPRTPPPSSPACILSTPRPVPRPAKTPGKSKAVETSDDEPPLLKTWSHPTLLSPIQDTIVVFQPNCSFLAAASVPNRRLQPILVSRNLSVTWIFCMLDGELLSWTFLLQVFSVHPLHSCREQDDNNDNPVADDDNAHEDEQPNNMPFNVSEFPRQLAAGDGHTQEDIRTALYQQQAESGRDHVANFNTTPPRTVTLTKLRTMYRNKDSLGAMGMLSGRHRLVIGNDHTIPKDGPNVVPRVGPHYIDHILYVGNRKGLDAAIPKIRADHNWQVTLDLANTHRLWPDSNVACLPFNPVGRMVYIGTRLQEQLWLAVVPTTFFEPNHPDNARAAYPALNAPSTALTQRHALMIVMFIAHAFTEMLLQDIHCRERYPVPLTRAAVKESTDILGRVDENHRRIILRLEDFKRLSHILNTGWDDWVAQAPPSWKEDNFLTNNAPVGVTIRYGQNQPLLVHGALDDERRNWDNDRNYTHIRQFTFSLATHISYLDVREWREVPNFQNGDGIIYDKSSDDPMRTEVNLEDLPLLDGDGFEINVYNEQGFRVPRRAPVQFSTCGALLNLHPVHELFRSDDMLMEILAIRLTLTYIPLQEERDKTYHIDIPERFVK
ncbi:hypothetical protein F4604DRAFT_1936310 [Suillus subluteus]|nr:hypothetical protein F4604DRAFT_1936310 [Suillus subluteus]